jgi:hypothetical protein
MSINTPPGPPGAAHGGTQASGSACAPAVNRMSPSTSLASLFPLASGATRVPRACFLRQAHPCSAPTTFRAAASTSLAPGTFGSRCRSLLPSQATMRDGADFDRLAAESLLALKIIAADSSFVINRQLQQEMLEAQEAKYIKQRKKQEREAEDERVHDAGEGMNIDSMSTQEVIAYLGCYPQTTSGCPQESHSTGGEKLLESPIKSDRTCY